MGTKSTIGRQIQRNITPHDFRIRRALGRYVRYSGGDCDFCREKPWDANGTRVSKFASIGP